MIDPEIEAPTPTTEAAMEIEEADSKVVEDLSPRLLLAQQVELYKSRQTSLR